MENKDNVREQLAAYAHDAWAGWMKYLFEKSTKNADGTATIPAWAVERWTFQMNTPYSELPENMKPSDREEADKMLKIVYAENKEPGIHLFDELTMKCDYCGIDYADVINTTCSKAPDGAGRL